MTREEVFESVDRLIDAAARVGAEAVGATNALQCVHFCKRRLLKRKAPASVVEYTVHFGTRLAIFALLHSYAHAIHELIQGWTQSNNLFASGYFVKCDCVSMF
jgi:hypothetical protein